MRDQFLTKMIPTYHDAILLKEKGKKIPPGNPGGNIVLGKVSKHSLKAVGKM